MSKTVTSQSPLSAQTNVHAVVVMGVSGCGKSSLAIAIAQDLDCAMLEGDAFHPAASQEKMAQGTATDHPRSNLLGAERQCSPLPTKTQRAI